MEKEENENSRVYEIGVQIIPIVGDTGANETYARLCEMVTSRGGQILSKGEPVLSDLAYSMHKIVENKKVSYNEAYFAWFKFELDASYAKQIEKLLINDSQLVRSIMFKTVRVNTFIQRKSVRRRSNEERSVDEIVLDELAIDSLVIDDVAADANLDDVAVNESTLEKKLSEISANVVE
jgi:ribosomal protein S6